jgi:hypothetical protein
MVGMEDIGIARAAMPPKNTLRRRRHTPRGPETGAVAEAMEVNVFDLHDRNRFEVGLCVAAKP